MNVFHAVNIPPFAQRMLFPSERRDFGGDSLCRLLGAIGRQLCGDVLPLWVIIVTPQESGQIADGAAWVDC